MKNKVRVLLCDDHTLFREGIKAILKDEPSIEIVGEAAQHAPRLADVMIDVEAHEFVLVVLEAEGRREAAYRDAEDLIQIGAYIKGRNRDVDRAIDFSISSAKRSGAEFLFDAAVERWSSDGRDVRERDEARADTTRGAGHEELGGSAI